ncbi:MAG: glutathione S-transferase N-terminal domain-containing protein [Nannocystaceae bacterium]|nr:glutathione S-transferase N-terminal domain-containing protein [bacterium]
MKLYQFAWGPYPRRIHIYAAEKGIDDLELVEVDVIAGEQHTPAFLAKNPAGTVPVLETDSGACIGQSVAILEYLETRYGGPRRAIPRGH